ncbi:MAG: HAMP domain-containing histidine kinase [Elusimicrobia bacterium]|nr:HAMP domain-containing histidine kinase [Elusimicrobiota bacterium]
MNLKTRFGLVIGTLVLLVVGATSGILYWTEKSFLSHEALERQETSLRSLSQVARESHLSQDDLMLINYVLSLPEKNPEVLLAYVVVPDAKGVPQVAAHSIKDFTGVPLSALPPEPTGARVLRETVADGERAVAEVVVASSLDRVAASVEASLSRTRRRIAVTAAAMVLAGLAASTILAVSLTRPISRLAAAAGLLGQGKLRTRIPVEGSDEIARLSREFNAMAEKLERLDEMKKDFVSSVTHELKSPLAAIDSTLELIAHEQGKGRDPSRWLEDLAAIRTHTSRLSRFVTDLLDLAKIERGSFSVQRSDLDLAAAAREVVSFLSPLARKNGVALSGPSDGAGLARASADGERVRQVLVNLVSNALKFTPKGGSVSVTVSAESEGTVCSVSDNGIGIKASDLDRVFDKFEQVKEARAEARGPKGTGLGLSICKAIVEAHGGRIWAESVPGRGSTFRFTLPSGGAE